MHSYKFYDMGFKPLAYPVKCNNKIVIPAGSTNVKIAFGQSHLSYWNEDRHAYVKMNVYLYKGKLYHV